MADYLLQFGDYEMPQTLRPADEAGSQDTGAQARPRAAGSVTQEGRRENTVLTIRGEIGGDGYTLAELLALEDELKAACYNGKQNLYFGRDDRYYRDAQVKSFALAYEEGRLFGVVSLVSINFEAADYPEAFGTAGATATLTSGGGSHSYSGTAYAEPAWSITIGSTGDGPLTLTNSTTGEAATIGEDGVSLTSGDVIVLNRETGVVTVNGTSTPGIVSGVIPRLAPGANTITLSAGGTGTASALSASYIPRYV